MKNKIFACFFLSLLSTISFAAALLFNLVPLAIICIVALAGCLLWFADIMSILDKQEKRQERRANREPIEEYRRIDFASDLEPERKGTVRPGSRPSIVYLNMRAEREGVNNDDSGKNNAAEKGAVL